MTPLPTLLSKMKMRPGATSTDIARCEEQLGLTLPADLVALLRAADGGEGFVGEEYLRLWGTQELAANYDGYRVAEFPGYLPFATNGGGESFGYDLRGSSPKIVMVPFLFEWDAAVEMGGSIREFLERAATIGYFGTG
jgi:cell wall assembly regulator SMI1